MLMLLRVSLTAVTMTKIEFLTILLVVTCLLGGVVSVTDKEFEVGTVLSSNNNVFRDWIIIVITCL